MASVPKRKKATPPEPGDAVPEMPEHGNHIMASVPRRKRKKPPDRLCLFVFVCFLFFVFYFRQILNSRTKKLPLETLNKIIVYIDLYVEEFDQKKPRMTDLGREFNRIGKQVQKDLAAGTVKKSGLVAGGIIGAIGALIAPLTGGASLAAGVAAGGGAVALGGVFAEHLMKSGGAEKRIKTPGNEFLNIIKPMANKLADIKKSCEKWEKDSANIQSEDVNQYRGLIRRVKSWSATRQEKAGDVQDSLRKTLELISNVRKTLSDKEVGYLSRLVIYSCGQCGNIISEFNNVKMEFIEFKKAVEKLKSMKTI